MQLLVAVVMVVLVLPYQSLAHLLPMQAVVAVPHLTARKVQVELVVEEQQRLILLQRQQL
jgi:hypothetical protein